MKIIRLALFLCFAFQAGHSPAADPSTYRFAGKVLMRNGEPFRRLALNIFLQDTATPFARRTLSDPAGAFTFKDLSRGTYVLILVHPRLGELRKTIEISPSLADATGRVSATIRWDPRLTEKKKQTVSAAALSIPDAARRLFRNAIALLGKRDVKGAVSRLKDAVQTAPRFVAAWNQLGTIAYQAREFTQAEAYFREALKQDPASILSITNMGGVLLSEGRFAEALPYNLEAVKALPGDPLAQSQLGRNYFFLGKDTEAEAHLKTAKELDPAHFSYPQLVLSNIYKRRGDSVSMIREMEEFLQLHPDSRFAETVRTSLLAAKTPPLEEAKTPEN